jgi:predicted dehydrogenase
MMRVVVGGLGFMGATHAGVWRRMDGVELYGVVSRDPHKTLSVGNLGRDAVALDFTKVKTFHNLADALGDENVDAVDLCTPTDRHATEAIAALQAGKHVLVEKPLALTGELADQVIEQAERSGRVLMAAQVLRFMPAYVRAKELTAELGPVRSAMFRRRCAAPAWSRWLTDTTRSGGGAFDLLIHDVDYARWLFGLPRNARASGSVDEKRGIDTLSGELDYEGFSVGISGGWHLTGQYPFSMEFTILCEGGVLEYSSEAGGLNLFRAGAAKEAIVLADTDPFELELDHFRDCVKRGTASPVCPPRESADAVKIMESLVRSRARHSE